MKLEMPGKAGWIFTIVTGLIALSLPLVLHPEHQGGWWESVPGFWGWFGALGCAVIVIVSKFLGKVFLQKPEDWYE